jgi:hypothetical protein
MTTEEEIERLKARISVLEENIVSLRELSQCYAGMFAEMVLDPDGLPNTRARELALQIRELTDRPSQQ